MFSIDSIVATRRGPNLYPSVDKRPRLNSSDRYAGEESTIRMHVNINANICDLATQHIAALLRDVFKILEKELDRDYGGPMQHLWIDFELSQFGTDRRPPLPFRLQKKVGGGISRLTGLRTEVYENVGHYSVRPDFGELLKLPLESVPTYALGLIYLSTSILVDKEKKLGGFDAERFRSDFLSSCNKHGYEIAV